jgi:hypothetical protein
MFRKLVFRPGFDANRPPDAIVHKPPQMPIMIDNTEASPNVVREFYGHPLYTVVDSEALDEKMLRIFTSRQQAEGYCRQLIDNQDPFWVRRDTFRAASSTAVAPPGFGYVELYEHTGFNGCVWRLLDNHNVGDFRTVVACGFLGTAWFGINADNKVSSVDSVSGWTVTVLCSGILLGGAWLFLPGDAFVPSLVPFGFNDIASSMLFLQF